MVNYVFLDPDGAAPKGCGTVLCPARWVVAGGEDLREAALIGPTCDANGALLTCLTRSRTPRADFAAIFAADPFALWDDIAAELAALGIPGVINYPTVGLVEGEMARNLAEVGLGIAAEAALMEQFRAKGFRCGIVIGALDDLAYHAPLASDLLILHGFMAQGDERDASLVTEASNTVPCPVILHASFWHDSAVALAQGVLR